MPTRKARSLAGIQESNRTPARFTLESAFGSVEPRSRPEDFKLIARDAKEEHAQRVVEKMQGRRNPI